MRKSSIFIGLDVHKSSIVIALAEAGRNSEGGRFRAFGVGPSKPIEITELLLEKTPQNPLTGRFL
jgi:hypothetical protein